MSTLNKTSQYIGPASAIVCMLTRTTCRICSCGRSNRLISCRVGPGPAFVISTSQKRYRERSEERNHHIPNRTARKRYRDGNHVRFLLGQKMNSTLLFSTQRVPDVVRSCGCKRCLRTFAKSPAAAQSSHRIGMARSEMKRAVLTEIEWTHVGIQMRSVFRR
jgi:hypothetical protein